MFVTTLASVPKSAALALTRRNCFAPAMAAELYTGRAVQVVRRSQYITPAGIVTRFTVRLHNGTEFDQIDAQFINNIENFTLPQTA
jgi:hypothetical protein